MPLAEDIVLVGERTPNYFSFPPAAVPKIIKDKLPDVKIIIVLCDPAKRAVSDFVHEVSTRDHYKIYSS